MYIWSLNWTRRKHLVREYRVFKGNGCRCRGKLSKSNFYDLNHFYRLAKINYLIGSGNFEILIAILALPNRVNNNIRRTRLYKIGFFGEKISRFTHLLTNIPFNRMRKKKSEVQNNYVLNCASVFGVVIFRKKKGKKMKALPNIIVRL